MITEFSNEECVEMRRLFGKGLLVGIPVEDRLEGLTAAERTKGLSVAELVEGLSAAELKAALAQMDDQP